MEEPTIDEKTKMISYPSVLLAWKNRMKDYIQKLIELKSSMDLEYMKFRSILIGENEFLSSKGKSLYSKYRSKINFEKLIENQYNKIKPSSYPEYNKIQELTEIRDNILRPKLFSSWILPSLKEAIQDSDKTLVDVLNSQISTLLSTIELKRLSDATQTVSHKLQLEDVQILKNIDKTKEDLRSPYSIYEREVFEFKSLIDRSQIFADDLFSEINSEFDKLSSSMQLIYDQIFSLEAEIKKYDKAFPAQGTPEFGLRLFLMFQDTVSMVKPPVPGKDEVLNMCPKPTSSALAGKCFGRSDTKSPNNYQVMLSDLLSPSGGNGRGLLAFHDVGTGKTCTALLFIQTYYMYLVNLMDNSEEDLGKIPSALVLLPSAAIMANYKKDFCEFCVHSQMPDIPIAEILEEKETPAGKTTTEWILKHPVSKIPTLRVVIQVMQNNLDRKYHIMWGRDDYSNESVVPDHGIIIVDEAHNLVNSREVLTTSLGQKRVLSYANAISKSNLPILLMTATPILSDERFLDLLLLLDLIRNKDKEPLSDQIYEFISDKNYEERNQKYIEYYFDKNDEGGYIWKKGKMHEFQSEVSGYISYYSLKNDPRVYPRLTDIQINDIPNSQFRFNRDGEVIDEERIILGDRESDRNPAKWELIRSKLFLNEKHFLFTPKPYYFTFKPGVLYMLRDYEEVNLDFLNFNNGVYNDQDRKWVDDWYSKQPKKRRFIYLGKRDSTEDPDYVKNRNSAYLALYNHKKNIKGEYIHVGIGNKFVKEGINVLATPNIHMISPPPTRAMFEQAVGRVLRYCSFNDFSDNPDDWTITLYMYVSENEKEQLKTLNVDTIKYGADPVEKNLDDEFFEFPSQLTIETMKRSAVDCLLYQDMTGVSNCYVPHKDKGLNKWDINRGICENPIEADSLIAIPSGSGLNFEYYCSQNHGIPGGMPLYTETDAFVWLNLKNKYSPIPLQDLKDLEEANYRVKKKLIWRSPKTGWRSWFYNKALSIYDRLFPDGKSVFFLLFKFGKKDYPFITMTPTVSPETLIRNVERNPPEIGNAIMFLLERKRKLSSPDVIERIDKKVIAKLHLISKYQELAKTFQMGMDDLILREKKRRKELYEISSALKTSKNSILKIKKKLD